MARSTLDRRVSILEEKMEPLEKLPARLEALESQVVRLRAELRAEFSAVRGEVAESLGAVRGEAAESLATLREDIRAGDEETRRYMRVLYEDLVQRITTIGDAQRGPRRKR